MNVAIHPTRATRDQQVLTVRLPSYIHVMLMVTIVMAALVTVWTLAARQDIQPQAPFSDYVEIMPGQPWNETVAERFSCDPAQNTLQGYCYRLPTTGPFSLVSTSLSNGVVSQTNFSVHDGALTVGDLALLWGRPNVSIFRQSVVLDWPRIGVTANGWAESWRFSFSIAVQRISFDVTS